MNKICINVHIPRAVAIAARAALFGDTVYEPSAEELGELSTAELTCLLAYEGEDATQRLQLTSYAGETLLWPQVKEAISKATLEKLKAQEANAERAKARIELFDWAVQQQLFPAIREAAAREYDVSARYVFELARLASELDLELPGLPPPIITCTEQLLANVTLEHRPSPSLYALSLESRLRVEVERLKEQGLAKGTELAVSSVSRMTPEHGERQTIVALMVSHPSSSHGFTVIWSAEDNRKLGPSVHELRDPGPEA